MKQFWKKYSYAIVKLFVNQFAIAIFGVVLALACGLASVIGTDYYVIITSDKPLETADVAGIIPEASVLNDISDTEGTYVYRVKVDSSDYTGSVTENKLVAAGFDAKKSEADTNSTLVIVTSAGAVLFYLFLIYTSVWTVGSKDKLRVDTGRKKANYLTGLYMSLLANLPNYLLAILITIGILGADGGVISAIGAVSSSVALFVEGMFVGLLTLDVGGAPLNSYFISYFIITVPALATSTVAYIFGLKNYHLTHIMLSDTPEEVEVKKEEKAKRKL